VAAGDEVQHAGATNPAHQLRHDVRQEEARWKSTSGPESYRDRGIEVAARDRPDRIGLAHAL